MVLLGDGADWIWRYGRQCLARKGVELVEIVDLYHAVEHLWTVAHAVFGAGSPQAVAWVAPLKRALQTDGVGPVLAALAALAPVAETAAAAEECQWPRRSPHRWPGKSPHPVGLERGCGGTSLRQNRQQIGDRDRLVAMWAGPTRADAAAEDAAVVAALLAEIACVASWAGVDGRRAR